MKKLILLFLSVAVSLSSFSQVDKVSPAGVKYIESFVDTSLVTVIYLHGQGQTYTALKNGNFYKKFFTDNMGRYNFFMPNQKTTVYSWAQIKNGGVFAPDFIHWLYKEYNLNPKKVILTGHSMGSPWASAYFLQYELGGIAVVAGSGDYTQVMALKKTKLPAIAYHGTADNSENSFYLGHKAAVTWYGLPYNKPGVKDLFIAIPNMGHGSDSYAYSKTSGLREWIDSLFPVIAPPPKKGIYVDGNYLGVDSVSFENHLITIIK